MPKTFFNFAVVTAAAFFCVSFACAGYAAYDDDFSQASNTDNYPGITNLQSAQLDINLASVIHQENLQIIQALQEIKERLNKLEASIQRIEQQVVRK